MTIAIAHRGDPLLERENTLTSFSSAENHGADMIELDLQRTRDGAIVVVHDPTLSRLWGLDRAVADLDLAEVKELEEAGQRIPTLSEALSRISVPIMIDFTGPEVVDEAVATVRRAEAMVRSLFVTHHVEALRRMRTLAPEARIGLSWAESDMPPPTLLAELGAEFWNPYFRLVTADRVAAMHDMGLKVSTWTVDERRHMDRVCEAGVDAVVTNRIADLRQYLS